ncbi:matrixin family metalloprotease [Solirubrum puertoriconensis]|nr:matrixin family metalloprotease [Solirubrum puertoriconensis]
MTKHQPFAFILFLWFAAATAAQAQEACMLEPVALSRRATEASLVVEARIVGQQAVTDAAGRIFTLNQLEVFKVFRGQVPAAGIQLAEPGGTLGLRREDVSGTAGLVVGEQGMFFLEADPAAPQPGALRLFAGPQGFVRYDAARHVAAEPFARYNSIENELYPAVERHSGRRFLELRRNAELSAPAVVARGTAAPVITGFSPTSLSSGTGAVLTITGSGFGSTRGTGKVEFPNADQGGLNKVAANSSDYVSWSDTKIEVRVPSSANGGGAGSGKFVVYADGSASIASATNLNIVYSYSNIGSTPARPRLINKDQQGGYTLQYNPTFADRPAARSAFERALGTWAAATRLRRFVGNTVNINTAASDNVNVVRFDVGAELPAGVLGRTTSYYSGCSTGGVTNWSVAETDFTFNDDTNWNFNATAPASTQYDFESVALHEQGHAHQLGHIIRPGAVMHYAIANGQQSRTLSAESDIAGGLGVINFSLTSPNPCDFALIQLLAAATPLPVELVSFTARYEATLPGAKISWATANELNSSYFSVQAADEQTASTWQEVARVNAAGQSNIRRTYEATDTRPLGAGQVRYYRLRQVDTDGSEHFSSAVAVSGGDAPRELQTFPNPVADVLQVRGPVVASTTAVRILLIDAAGRTVKELRLPTGTSAAAIPVADLRNGLYTLQWQAEDSKALRGRVLVQH